MITECPWCQTTLVVSGEKTGREGNKYKTLYCDNKNCSKGFESDIEVDDV